MKTSNASIFTNINTNLAVLFVLCLTLINTPVLAWVEADCILISITYRAVGHR